MAVQQEEDIHLTLVFTPPASRTSGVEKNAPNNPPISVQQCPPRMVSKCESIPWRIRWPRYFHKPTSNSKQSSSLRESGVAELAARVANGTAVAPTGFVKARFLLHNRTTESVSDMSALAKCRDELESMECTGLLSFV